MDTETIPPILKEIKTQVYDACGFSFTHFINEKESAEYDACRFQLNERNIVFRTSKITPTKIGQFVTVWKRTPKGPIAPFDGNDPVDLFIIAARSGNRFGQFVFPKEVLMKQAIVTAGTKEGKRGIRVYPPWDVAVNSQAKKTQQWQGHYFLEIHEDNPVNQEKAKALYFQ